MRPLVLKTVLTYLELDGFLRQGTPFYAGYSLRPPASSLDDVFAGFDPARADFLRRVLASGKTGRIWTSIDPEQAAAALGEERSRIVAALGYLEQRGLVELKPADARQRYTVLARPDSLGDVLDRLAERFDRREQAETERIAARRLARHPRRLPGRGARRPTSARRAPSPAATAASASAGEAQRLPEPTPLPAIDTRRRPQRARGAPRRAPGRARRAEAARALPLRPHEPGDDPREADPRAALRRPRRPPLRGGARLVRKS